MEWIKTTPENIKKIEKYFFNQNFKISWYTKGWQLMWSGNVTPEFAIIENCYVARCARKNGWYYTYPISINNVEDENKCLKYLLDSSNTNYSQIVFYGVPQSKICVLSGIFTINNTMSINRKYLDYLYDINAFSNLQGGKYSSIRNYIKRFITIYPNHTITKIDKSNIQETKDFIKDWWVNNKQKAVGYFGTTARVVEAKLLDHFEDLNFLGIIIKVNNKIASTSIGEICGDTLFAHIEKVDSNFSGLSPFTANAFAKTFAKDGILYLNREDDIGQKGLRKSKLQYKPIRLVNWWTFKPYTFISFLKKVPELVSERLVYKDITDKDTNFLDLWMNEELNKYYIYHYSEEFPNKKVDKSCLNLKWFLDKRKKWNKNKEEVSWGIFLNNKLIGDVVLYDFSYDHSVWIGYRVLKKYQQLGYAVESAKAITEFAIYELGVEKIYAKVFKENVPSKKLLNKIGMKNFKEDEKFSYYSIDARH